MHEERREHGRGQKCSPYQKIPDSFYKFKVSSLEKPSIAWKYLGGVKIWPGGLLLMVLIIKRFVASSYIIFLSDHQIEL